jgi:hypothetical protein
MVGSTIWLTNVYWNFRIFYLLPLILYFLVLFYKREKAVYLWLAGLVSVTVQFGIPPYFAALNMLIVSVFLVFMIFRKRTLFKTLFAPEGPNAAGAAAFLAVAGLFVLFALHMYDHIDSMQQGRSSDFTVPLQLFLQHGGYTGPEKFLTALYPSYVPLKMSVFVGGLTLAFLLTGLVCVRNLFHAALAASLFLIGALSLGANTPIAEFIYEIFPPIRLFRYVGILGGLMRPFLILLAGFGLDHFLAHAAEAGSSARRRVLLAFPASLAVVLGFMVWMRLPFDAMQADNWVLWPQVFSQGLVITAAGGLAVLLAFRFPRLSGLIAVAALTANLYLFQAAFFKTWPMRIASLSRELLEVFPFQYQEARGLKGTQPRMVEAEELLNRSPARFQKEIYNFLFFDTYHAEEYTNFEWNEWFGKFFMIARSSCFGTVGCEGPKLRLVTDVEFSPSTESAGQSLFRLNREPEKVFLEGIPAEIQASWTPAPNAEAGRVKVTDFSFNRLEAEADVTYPKGAWLYYVDAWHPGWHASVDGKQTAVNHANVGFKAVFVPHGRHRVKLYYWNDGESFRSVTVAAYGIFFTLALFVFAADALMPLRRAP